MELNSMHRGDGIVVGVGARGTQYALVVSVRPDGSALRAHKWLARGRRWTNAVTVYPVDVLRRALLGEYHPTVPCPMVSK